MERFLDGFVLRNKEYLIFLLVVFGNNVILEDVDGLWVDKVRLLLYVRGDCKFDCFVGVDDVYFW